VLVDTHCHLDPQYFPSGPDEVIARAREAGVEGFVVIGVGTDLAPARAAVALAKRMNERAGAAIGVHPHDASSLDDAAYEELARLAAEPEVVAIGEIGLDYHYDHSPRELQRDRFARQLQLAKELGKPVVVHSREADLDTAGLLKEHLGPEGGVIHCFTSDWAAASAYLDLGMSISLSGVITFKTAEALRDAAVRIPLERLLIETDAPFLAPIPFRGKRNEPAYVRKTAERLAELKGVSLEALAEATTANARRALRLPAS
jgi:TatD DNase family protein